MFICVKPEDRQNLFLGMYHKQKTEAQRQPMISLKSHKIQVGKQGIKLQLNLQKDIFSYLTISSDSVFNFSKWEIKLKEVKVKVKSYLETRWQN